MRKQPGGHLAQVFGSCWQLEETFPAFCLDHRLVTSQDAGLPSLCGTGLQRRGYAGVKVGGTSRLSIRPLRNELSQR